MTRYYQESQRDGDGDIFITQYREETRASGIVVPHEIGVVGVVSQVSSAQLVSESQTGLLFSPASEKSPPIDTQRFSVEPAPLPLFRQLSTQAIIAAHHYLNEQNLQPIVQFGSKTNLETMDEHDKVLLTEISQNVIYALQHKNSNPDDQLPIGNYL